MSLTRIAFRLRDTAVAGFVARQGFAHASRLLPLRRVAESEHVLAFHHPVPGFEPIHVLLVPKLSARSVLSLPPIRREQIASEIEELVPECLEKVGCADSGWLVIVNGGVRQDVRQVHAHLLIAGYDLARAPSAPTGVWTDIPDRANALHQVRIGDGALAAGLAHACDIGEALQLERRGYSIVRDGRVGEERGRGSEPVVHLTAGMQAPSA